MPVPHSTQVVEMTICKHMKFESITERLTTCRGLRTTHEHRLTDCIVTRHLHFLRKNKSLISQFTTLCSLLPTQRHCFDTANTCLFALMFS